VNRNDTAVTLEVIDEGTGFHLARRPGDPPPKNGVGIPGMKERVRRFGGTIDISSSPKGTRVRAWLPIRSHSN
jgi:two-component system, NarL family, sensor kinase